MIAPAVRRLARVTLYAAAVAGVMLSSPPAGHSARRPRQTICYMGRSGSPGGCVTVRPAGPRFGRVAE